MPIKDKRTSIFVKYICKMFCKIFTWTKFYKTFYGRNLLIFVMSLLEYLSLANFSSLFSQALAVNENSYIPSKNTLWNCHLDVA